MIRRTLMVAVLLGCSPTGTGITKAIEDCRLRARAAAGGYNANYELCLRDRRGMERAARDLAEAEDWRLRARAEETRSDRWSSFRLYAASLRLAAVRLPGTGRRAWADSLITQDSVLLIRVFEARQ